jgi:hypothetical protein
MLVCCHIAQNICSIKNIIIEKSVHSLDNTPSIDLGLLVSKLPYDILLKIYREYFRPHKFLNIYTQLIEHSWRISAQVRCQEFQRHLPYLLYSQIRPFIIRNEPAFADIWAKLCINGFQIFSKSWYDNWYERDKPVMKLFIYDQICMYKRYYIDENYFYY